MAPKYPLGRRLLIVGVAAAMAGTLGLIVAAGRSIGPGHGRWPRLGGAWGQQEATHDSHRVVPLAPGIRRLEIVTDGRVRVTPGQAGTLDVHATVHTFGQTRAQADEGLKAITWTADPAYGNAIRLNGTFHAQGPRLTFNGRGLAGSPYADFAVQAPPGLQVVVRSESGTVYVAGMAGADLKTDSGDIHVADLTGEVIAESDSGNVNARNVPGALRARTDSGAVTVVAAGTVKIETDTGAIRVENAGRTGLRSDHGTIEVQRIRGLVTAETRTGRIRAAEVGAGAILTSDHGSIDGKGIRNGRLEARTETGSIDLDQHGVTDVDYDVRTAHGSIDVAIPRSAALTVAMRSDHGHVGDGFGLPAASDGQERGQIVHGQLGNGSHHLSIVSETGSIDLQPAT